MLYYKCLNGICLNNLVIKEQKNIIMIPQPKLFQMVNVPKIIEHKYVEYKLKFSLENDLITTND